MTEDIRKAIMSGCTYTTRALTNGKQLSAIEIQLPGKPEQRRIAEALSDMDALLAAMEELIAKKRTVKQGAMQGLLTGKRRLPGFEDEWIIKRLGSSILKVGHGKSQHEIEMPSGKYPILATGGEIGRTDSYLYDKPSILIGRKGTIDKPQYMDTPFWTIDTLFYTMVSKEHCAKYLYYLFCTINWNDYNEASGVPSLSSRVIEDIEVTVPSKPEQAAIAEIISDMDAEIDALTAKLNKIHNIKQGMMSELLTGHIRLTDETAAVMIMEGEAGKADFQ
jgi:type I restriction enzyme S subunit